MLSKEYVEEEDQNQKEKRNDSDEELFRSFAKKAA